MPRKHLKQPSSDELHITQNCCQTCKQSSRIDADSKSIFKKSNSNTTCNVEALLGCAQDLLLFVNGNRPLVLAGRLFPIKSHYFIIEDDSVSPRQSKEQDESSMHELLIMKKQNMRLDFQPFLFETESDLNLFP